MYIYKCLFIIVSTNIYNVKIKTKYLFNYINEYLYWWYMSNKLEVVRTAVELNKQEFCKKLEITYQTYQNYLNGRDISTDVAIHLNKKFNININWLLTSSGEMFNTDKNEIERNKEVNEPRAEYNSIENILIEDIKKLSQKRQEYYYHRVKADLLDDEI